MDSTKNPRENFQVCLLRPPTINHANTVATDATPPLALAYLASSLEHEGFVVTGIDAVGEAIHQYSVDEQHPVILHHGLTTEEILERIPQETKALGISIMFSIEWLFTKKLVQAIKKQRPDITIIAGGEHITACTDYVLNTCPEIDVCVKGEGEQTLIDLCHCLQHNHELSSVNGIAFNDNGKIVHTDKQKRIRDIDKIPRPNWNHFPITEYIDNAFTHGMNLGRTMPMLASRGCPYQCTFCSSPQMWTTLWRVRDPEDVVDEIKGYIKKYNTTNFDFYDLTAIIQKKWIIDFCKILARENLQITWQLPSGTRSEAMDKEVCEWMFRSGCRAVSYAPESGSPTELKRIKKRANLNKMLKSMCSAVKSGIKVKCNMIFGMPGQNYKEVLENFVFFTRLAWIGVHDIACFPFSPYPGSEIFNDLINSGKIKLDDDYLRDMLLLNNPEKTFSYTKHISPKILSKLTLLGMAYFFALSYSFRPLRGIKFLLQIIKKDNTNNKLLMALSNRHRKQEALKKAQGSDQNTVVLSPLFRPKEVVRKSS
jgi:anaerobic magnesium-protoporphyrin IX monomethyl ester cyclase